MTVKIPDKLYFKIGEVADLMGVEPYVLRYWETEFGEIAPVKSRSNQRLYRKKDVETVVRIRSLLYDEGFTIEGAKKKLQETISAKSISSMNTELLGVIRKELAGLLEMIGHN